MAADALDALHEALAHLTRPTGIRTGHTEPLAVPLWNPHDSWRTTAGGASLLFAVLAANPHFAGAAWEHHPVVARKVLHTDAALIGWKDILAASDAHVLDRTSGFATKGSLTVGAEPHPGTISSADLHERLAEGSTFYTNVAAAVWPGVASLSAHATMAFHLGVSANVYATAHGFEALPAHNDLQDTLILQHEGHKTWRLFEPAAALPIFELQRGKSGHGLPSSSSQPITAEELGRLVTCGSKALSPSLSLASLTR